jgi:simple sugar transport system ATP-binding protein
MVHQHFKLVPSLTVAENIFLGMEPTRFGLIDRRAQAAKVRELSDRFGLRVDPDDRVRDLSVGIHQRIEILKVLIRGARTVILDEPTAVLTPQESRDLFRILRGFVAQGMTVIFITHHLDEVVELSDMVTVLRHGRTVATRPTAEVTKSDLVQMMVGKQVSFDRPARKGEAGGAVLDVRELWARDDRGLPALRDVSFVVREREIVGIAGVAGNGQTELAEVLSGLRRSSHGTVTLGGRPIVDHEPGFVRRAGLAHVPGDRMTRGVDRFASIELNMIMGRHDRAPWAKGGVLQRRPIAETAASLIRRFDVRAPNGGVAVKTLSGGNIQKVVVAREFSRETPFLLVDQPTRGVDIGAMEAIHADIIAQRDRGAAILLISVQLDEILALSDRILVLFGGGIIGEVDPLRTSEEEIGFLMAGVRPDAVLASVAAS